MPVITDLRIIGSDFPWASIYFPIVSVHWLWNPKINDILLPVLKSRELSDQNGIFLMHHGQRINDNVNIFLETSFIDHFYHFQLKLLLEVSNYNLTLIELHIQIKSLLSSDRNRRSCNQSDIVFIFVRMVFRCIFKMFYVVVHLPLVWLYHWSRSFITDAYSSFSYW